MVHLLVLTSLDKFLLKFKISFTCFTYLKLIRSSNVPSPS
jgi:hypothetical protein